MLGDLITAIDRLTEQFRLYNQAHEPQKAQRRGDAELFRADSESAAKRELHESLVGLRDDRERTRRGSKTSETDP